MPQPTTLQTHASYALLWPVLHERNERDWAMRKRNDQDWAAGKPPSVIAEFCIRHSHYDCSTLPEHPQINLCCDCH